MNYTKGSKLKAKKALPELAPIPAREKNGRAQRETRTKDGQERDADSVALKARARKMGVPEKHFKDMRGQELGDQAGMALSLRLDKDTAKRLHGHYIALSTAEARYHKTMGLSIHPKTAKIEMEPDVLETRPDDRPDTRTEEERDMDACAAWHRWNSIVQGLSSLNKFSIRVAIRGFAPLVRGGDVSVSGRYFVEAMLAVDDAIS